MVFMVGIAALVVAFFQGQATLALFIIFPVVTATGGWAVLGILLMIVGFLLFFLTWPVGGVSAPISAQGPGPAPSAGAISPPELTPSMQRHWGGVVFIGPVPLVFGSDQKVTQWMLVLGIVLFVALVILTIIALRGI
jgi:uncharacterized membrane protein